MKFISLLQAKFVPPQSRKTGEEAGRLLYARSPALRGMRPGTGSAILEMSFFASFHLGLEVQFTEPPGNSDDQKNVRATNRNPLLLFRLFGLFLLRLAQRNAL